MKRGRLIQPTNHEKVPRKVNRSWRRSGVRRPGTVKNKSMFSRSDLDERAAKMGKKEGTVRNPGLVGVGWGKKRRKPGSD